MAVFISRTACSMPTNTARLMMEAMKWADYPEKKQVLIGGLSGFTYMTAVEMMDGFSDAHFGKLIRDLH